MAIRLSTAGITVNYAVETSSNTRPTTGYTKIPEIKAIPELNPEPDSLETTTLEETEYKTYIPGLKDLGGSLSFTANLTAELITAWDELVEEYNTAATTNKNIWFCVIIPGLDESLYFMAAAEVSSVLEVTLYITPTGAPIWEAKPTDGV